MIMVGGDRTKLGALVALVLVGTLALSGCAEEKSNAAVKGKFPDISLAETKSPVQFLRNDAASRIPTSVIDSVQETADESVPCLEKSEDPKETVRSWHSTAVVTIVSGSAWRVESIVDNLIQSFTDQGWTARSLGQTADFRSSLLTSTSSLAELQVIGQRPDKDQTENSTAENVDTVTVEVQVHGPCVRTDGKGSDEIMKLEVK